MIALNLEAVGTEQTIIKEWLEQNVSEVLADKINNGVSIVKDGITLTNKKTLATFMTYTCDEAKKLAEKNARFACVNQATVFGWCAHYFEEDEIVGTLYTEDGSEYKPPKPVARVSGSNAVVTPPPTPKPKPQIDMFELDFSGTESVDQVEVPELQIAEIVDKTAIMPDEISITAVDPIIEQLDEPTQSTQTSNDTYIDNDGVIHNIEPATTNIIDDVPSTLLKLIGAVKVRCE